MNIKRIKFNYLYDYINIKKQKKKIKKNFKNKKNLINYI